jgi:hypothetical protein
MGRGAGVAESGRRRQVLRGVGLGVEARDLEKRGGRLREVRFLMPARLWAGLRNWCANGARRAPFAHQFRSPRLHSRTNFGAPGSNRAPISEPSPKPIRHRGFWLWGSGGVGIGVRRGKGIPFCPVHLLSHWPKGFGLLQHLESGGRRRGGACGLRGKEGGTQGISQFGFAYSSNRILGPRCHARVGQACQFNVDVLRHRLYIPWRINAIARNCDAEWGGSPVPVFDVSGSEFHIGSQDKIRACPLCRFMYVFVFVSRTRVPVYLVFKVLSDGCWQFETSCPHVQVTSCYRHCGTCANPSHASHTPPAQTINDPAFNFESYTCFGLTWPRSFSLLICLS